MMSCANAKVLFCSFVRSKIEYANVFWFPYYEVHKKVIKGVQNIQNEHSL